MKYRVTQKKRAPILVILNTRGPFFLGHPMKETYQGYKDAPWKTIEIERDYLKERA